MIINQKFKLKTQNLVIMIENRVKKEILRSDSEFQIIYYHFIFMQCNFGEKIEEKISIILPFWEIFKKSVFYKWVNQ
jgi:hypothetical protein